MAELRAFDLKEVIQRCSCRTAFFRVGNGEERVRMNRAFQIRLLPIEGKTMLCAKLLEGDMKERDLQFVVKRAQGGRIETCPASENNPLTASTPLSVSPYT